MITTKEQFILAWHEHFVRKSTPLTISTVMDFVTKREAAAWQQGFEEGRKEGQNYHDIAVSEAELTKSYREGKQAGRDEVQDLPVVAVIEHPEYSAARIVRKIDVSYLPAGTRLVAIPPVTKE